MFSRRSVLKVAATLVAAAALAFAPEARAADTLRVATAFSETSLWGRALRLWADTVKQQTSGAVLFEIHWSACTAAVLEGDLVGQVASGQLDGASVTSLGLGRAYGPIDALSMPGLFTTWSKMDAALGAMKGDFESGAQRSGVTVVAWQDFGGVRILSRDFQATKPADVVTHAPARWVNDRVQTALYQAAGWSGINSSFAIARNLLGFEAPMLMAPYLLAEAFSWTPQLDTIDDFNVTMMVGGIVLSSRRLASIADANRAIVLEAGRSVVAALNATVRRDEEAIYRELPKGKTLATTDKAKWDTLFKATRQSLRQNVFTPGLVDRLEALAR